MKTRAKQMILGFLSLSLAGLILTSCGADNSSGGSNSNNSGSSITASGNGNSLPSNWRNVIMNEYPCTTYNANGSNSQSRRTLSLSTSSSIVSINANSIHAGVTVEGDVLIRRRSGNTITTELYACERPNFNSSRPTAQYATSPVLNTSRYCSVGEISAANIYVGSSYGNYQLAFFPIGYSGASSLCSSGYSYSYSY